MKSTVFFVAVNNDKEHMEKEIDYLNFDVVMINRGHFPQKSCVWMRWLKGEEKTIGEHFFDKFDGTFNVSQRGISLIRGTIFPESLVWDGDYEEIFVLGMAEELKTYIECFLDHTQSTAIKHEECPKAFVYKLECEKISSGIDNVVKVVDKGFLYRSEA